MDVLEAHRREAKARVANGFLGTDAQAANLLDMPARYWIVHFHPSVSA